MKRLLLFILLFLAAGANAQEREMEIWNLNQVTVHPVHNISLKVSEKLHYSTTRSDLQLKYAELKLGHHPKKWMEYGGAYRLTSVLLTENTWETENRVMLFFDVREPVKKFTLSFANRIEYRDFKHFDDHFRHRQSLKVDFPSLVNWGMRFYITEESFCKFNADNIHLARIYTGITVLDKKHLNVSTYYALQKTKLRKHWYSSDVVGLNLNFLI